MFTCFNTEISHISAIHQKIEKEVPESSPLQQRIGCIAVSALETYICTQFMCGDPALCNVCCVPAILLDGELQDLLSPLNSAFTDEKLPPVGFKKSECCRTTKVAALTLNAYTKEKCCPTRSSIISKDVRWNV